MKLVDIKNKPKTLSITSCGRSDPGIAKTEYLGTMARFPADGRSSIISIRVFGQATTPPSAVAHLRKERATRKRSRINQWTGMDDDDDVVRLQRFPDRASRKTENTERSSRIPDSGTRDINEMGCCHRSHFGPEKFGATSSIASLKWMDSSVRIFCDNVTAKS
ncbi:MAG TPA: hypothetical protein VMG82_03385 [Candidatus Sulfotelmatobacter sp.]|nr:hypothetical protein [Candidatus Sulfotelmatobacter sp.]